jgi:hypothetical protein
VLGELEGDKVLIPTLMMGNQSTFVLIKNPMLSGRSKHIEVKYHLVRESAEKGRIDVRQVKADDQLGDILTKVLKRIKF